MRLRRLVLRNSWAEGAAEVATRVVLAALSCSGWSVWLVWTWRPPSPAQLPPSVIAAARADCGMLAQVGSAQLVAEGVGRSLRWGGSRRCRGSGAPAGPRGAGGLLHRLHHPSVALGQLLARPEPGLVVVCLRRLATAGFAQNHPAPPLPCLLPCLFRPPAEPEASEDEYECRREAAATVCIPVSVAVSLSDGQPQKHTLRSGTRV